MRKAHLKTAQGVDYLEVEGQAGGPCVFILHGYGANLQDLAPLAQEMDLPSEWTWIFPNGLFKVPISFFSSGQSWFHVDFEELAQAIELSEETPFSQRTIDEFLESREKLLSLLKELQKKHSFLILGGFSQGAMMATDLALSLDPSPKALLVFSGALVTRNRLQELLKENQSSTIPVFQSHGEQDPVVNFQGGKNLSEFLKKNGFSVESHWFQGGHELPRPILEKATQFIQEKT